jgi:hypothetical protein
MSMLVLRRLEDQSRLLEKVVVLTALELLWKQVLVGMDDGELLERRWLVNNRALARWAERKFFRRHSVSKFMPLVLEHFRCHS